MNVELTEEENKKLDEWANHGCDVDAGSIGGRISFIYTPTGLGPISEAKCLCGATLDFTDFDAW